MVRQPKIDWQEDEQTLYTLYKQEKDHQNRTRLHALWQMRQGMPMNQVAPMVGVHYRSVQWWAGWYREGGVEAVLNRRHGGQGGPQRRLTKEQEAELKAKAVKGEIKTIDDGVRWAQQTHEVTYSYWGMRWVYQRLGLKLKTTRPHNPKASEREQTVWKKGG